MSRYALTVRVIGAMDVISNSKRTKYLKSTPDLYCQVAVLPTGSTDEGKQRTKVATPGQGNDPKWNEVLEFQLAPSALLPDVVLEFSIFDQNRGRDTAVAKATFAVSRYAGKGLQSGEEWMSLSSAKKEAAGRLHAHVAWTRVADHPQNGASGEERSKALVAQMHKRQEKNMRNNVLFSQFSGLESKPLAGAVVDEPCTLIAPDQTAVDARVVIGEQLQLQFFKGRKPTQGQSPWKVFPLQHCRFADVCRQELLDSYDSASLYSADGTESVGMTEGSTEVPVKEEETCWECPSAEVIEQVTPGLIQFQALWRAYREHKKFKRSPGHQKRCGHLVQELLSTERKYVESLGVLTDVLLAPMKDSEGLRVLTSSLYEYACQLLDHHASLLPRLEELATDWCEEKGGLGELFATISGFSGTYTSYVKHYSEVLALISSARRHPDNAALISQLESDPRCNRAQLNSFLILPVQRVPRYRMFLTDLIKYAPPNSSDLQAMSGSASHIAKLATTMDEHCMSIENVKRVLAIQEKFVGQPTFAEPSRHYVREANMALWPAKQQHKVFLMNDVLIVGTLLDKEAKDGPSFKLRSFVELKDVVLFPMGHDTFQLADSCTGQVAVMLTCSSTAVQQAWVADLRRLLSAPPMRQESRKLQFEHQLRLQEAESNAISFSYCGSTWKVALENRIRKDKILNTLLACSAYLRGEVVAELCAHVGSRGNDCSRGRKGTAIEGVDAAYRELVKLTSDDESCHSAVTSALSSLLAIAEKEQAMASLADSYKEHLSSLEATKRVQHQLLLQQNFIQAESNFTQPSVWKKVARRQVPPQLASQKSTLLSGFLHGTSLSKDLHKRGRPRRASVAELSRSSSPLPQGSSSSHAPESSRSRSRKDLKIVGLEGEVAALRTTLDSVVASQTNANSTIASLLVTIEKQEAISQRVLRHLDSGSSKADERLREVNEEQTERILVLERDLLVKDKEIELLHLRLTSLEQGKKAAEQEQAELLQASLQQQEKSNTAIAALTQKVADLANLVSDPSGERHVPVASHEAEDSAASEAAKASELAPKKHTNRRSMSLATVTKGIRKKVSRSGEEDQPDTPGKKGRGRERKMSAQLPEPVPHPSDDTAADNPEAADEPSPAETRPRKSKKSKRKSRSEKSEKKVRKKKEKKKEPSEIPLE